jgi:2'-5' RNA ligase
MVRTFIAVDISQQAKGVLAGVTKSLQDGGVSWVRWVRPEGIHLTLKFLGEIDPNIVDRVLGAMDRAVQGNVPFTLALSGIGAFPNLNVPRVIWVGLKGDLDTLRELQERIDEEVHLAVGFPKETRAFTPHLTLGRMRDNAPGEERRRAGKAMTEVAWETDVSWQVSEVDLIRSTLTPSGAVYDVLGSRRL